MRTRSTSILLLCGSLLLLSAGCRKTGLVRAPTRVVAEEPEQPVVSKLVRAGSEEQEPAAPPKDLPPPTEAVAFHFPADRGGELLSHELTPTRPLPEPTVEPHRLRGPAQLDAPELPLPPSFVGHAAVPPERARAPLLPRRLTTLETPVSLALEAALPEAQPLAVGDRTKEPGANVNKPAPLPILGQPVPDRASLADATGDASGAAIVAATMPIRQRPVAFQRLGVPDPFENYRPLRLALPAEATDPVAASPRLPK